jgi:hypothetical protein
VGDFIRAKLHNSRGELRLNRDEELTQDPEEPGAELRAMLMRERFDTIWYGAVRWPEEKQMPQHDVGSSKSIFRLLLRRLKSRLLLLMWGRCEQCSKFAGTNTGCQRCREIADDWRFMSQ